MLDSVASNDPALYDYNVADPNDNPTDTVSSIAWAPINAMYMFACSDWDSKIRIYEVQRTQGFSQKLIVQKACFEVEEPCLCVAWEDDITKLFAGSIDNTVKLFDIMTGKAQNIGQHDAGVKDVYWIQPFNALCSLSFDKTMKLWDPRQQNPVKVYYIGQKIYCSDLLFPNIAMGLSNEKILVLDLLRIDEMMQNLNEYMVESPLGNGSQLTGVSFFSDGTGIGSCSHDGRANLSTFRTSPFSSRMTLSNIMTFRGHKNEDSTVLYHVHGIGFNPRSKNLVYTAGSEGIIYFWDYIAKSKITALNYNKAPVTKVKMSPDGIFMAYALGYDWARGVEGAKSVKTRIAAHEVEERELTYERR